MNELKTDITVLLSKLRKALEQERLGEEERDGLVEEILAFLSTTLQLPFGKDRAGYLKDFCATWDDVVPVLADFLSSSRVALTQEQKQRIVEFLIRRYASHEPGGRTAVAQFLIREGVNVKDYVPGHLLKTLVKRTANATLDGTFPDWDVHVHLLKRLARLVSGDSVSLSLG